jgi:hypothetical protein
MCRSRSEPRVPLGSQPVGDRGNDRRAAVPTAIRLAISLIMAAAPEESLASDEAPKAAKSKPQPYEERFPDAKTMIDADIAQIAQSPWGGTNEGKEIVRRLRGLNIKYGDTEGDRGSIIGNDVLVNESYYFNAWKTILELVHEGSHANWDWHKHHGPRTGKKSTDPREDNIEDELQAQKNQLVIYRWLKRKFPGFTDSEMEKRLTQEADGTLRNAIEQRIQSGESQH